MGTLLHKSTEGRSSPLPGQTYSHSDDHRRQPSDAAAIAAEAGVDDFLAEATPEAKLELIRNEQAEGQLVAMCNIAQTVFPAQANASLLERDGQIVGSALVAQGFTAAHYFHPRPSVAAFDATTSVATNFGPTNAELIAQVSERAEVFRAAHDVIFVPIDAVTSSASGLDPHISPQNARIQASCVAQARDVATTDVLALMNSQVEGPCLGLFSAPRLNVLQLNLALDAAFPLPSRERQATNGYGDDRE